MHATTKPDVQAVLQWLTNKVYYVEYIYSGQLFHFETREFLKKQLSWLDHIIPNKEKLNPVQVLEWLENHVQYIRHGARLDKTAYWPQDDCSLQEYVLERITNNEA